MKFLVIDFWARAKIVLMWQLLKFVSDGSSYSFWFWMSRWKLIPNWWWRSRWKCRLSLGLCRRLCWIRWRLLRLVWSEHKTRRQMSSKLAGFNRVKLEFWKAVRFSSDELVGVAVVKEFPQVLFFHR
jgi:hypothetical protein